MSNESHRLRERLDRTDVEWGQSRLRTLHRHPELSGLEERTALLVAEELQRSGADEVLTGVGSLEGSRAHGVLARFGPREGAGVLLRCELDALPIEERTELAYRSEIPGCAHLCGHDGHMAILLTVARVLGRSGGSERVAPRSGPVWLLFQPAEETGAGARAVCADARMAGLDLRRAYALHNLPGYPLGAVVARAGTMCCASTGAEITLRGRAAHAAQPETGRSPARALAELIAWLEDRDDPPGLDFATVVGAELGERAFGTAPDTARLFVTMRSAADAGLSARLEALREHTAELASRDGLETSIALHDGFKATVSDEQEIARVRSVARALPGTSWVEPTEAFRWSEDFGELLASRRGAFIGLGAGEKTPALHDPEYVFPSELIERGARLWLALLDQLAEEAE